MDRPTGADARTFLPSRLAWTITLSYLIFGVLWILLSDRALMLTIDDARLMAKVQTLKGWGFITATSALLWMLIYFRVKAHRRSETARNAHRENFEDLFHAVPTAMLTADADGRITRWNKSAEILFGWRAGELIGRTNPTIPPDDARDINLLRQRVLEGEVFNNRIFTRLRRDGSTVEVSLSMAPFRDPTGKSTGVISVMTDVTEQRRLERLQRERRSLLESSQAMNEVLGIIGHELRTPLAGLRAMSEYLLTDGDRSDPEQLHSFIRSIHNESLRLTEMANNMLESARLNSGKARWNWETVPLQHVCHEALEIIQPLCQSHEITFEANVSPSDLSLNGDICALRRLVLNLLSNAVKHTTKGVISVEAREMNGPDHRWMQLQITDTGRGISPDVQQHLGRAFAANSGAIHSKIDQRIGLGLAICKDIVLAHGGRMSVRSARDQGTSFSVLLRCDLDGPVDAEGEEMSIECDIAA